MEQFDKNTGIELTVVMPCLNEAETLAVCIDKAQSFFKRSGVAGEVLIADNGSTDGSIEIAQAHGARVVNVPIRGYGAALINGIKAAKGKYVIMGDSDDSYDFSRLELYVEKLREGYDLVMGNRFKGGIEKGAMPFLHKYLGNPVLSFIGRIFFNVPTGDFHCGLRGFRQDIVDLLNLETTGMEFASEMVVKSALAKLKIAEVPTTLKPDGRSRPPHLRTWRDGWRHLRFLLIFSPRWLFLYPGLALMLLGMVIMAAIFPAPLQIGEAKLDVNTMLFGSAFLIAGYNTIVFAVFTRLYAVKAGFLPEQKFLSRYASSVSLETGLIIGGIILATGLGLAVYSFVFWQSTGFGDLERSTLRLVIMATTLLVVGLQTLFNSFFLSILALQRKS